MSFGYNGGNRTVILRGVAVYFKVEDVFLGRDCISLMSKRGQQKPAQASLLQIVEYHSISFKSTVLRSEEWGIDKYTVIREKKRLCIGIAVASPNTRAASAANAKLILYSVTETQRYNAVFYIRWVSQEDVAL